VRCRGEYRPGGIYTHSPRKYGVVRFQNRDRELPNGISTPKTREKDVTVPQEDVALAVEELERLAVEYEVDPIDGVISTCYRLIGSFERAIRDKRALQAISPETLPRTLREIANKAFTVGWNSQNLTSIQRAQILDVLLSVANLAEYSFQHRL
jgi:hypothetical protein